MLLSLVYRLIEADKKIRYYGTGEQLTESEIHMIKAVRDNEGLHITGLAKGLNITKGAVSQVVMKLEKKGMVVKERDAGNMSRLLLRLTQKGEAAYKTHELFHRKFEAYVEKTLKDATPENREFLKGFMVSLGQVIEEFEAGMDQ